MRGKGNYIVLATIIMVFAVAVFVFANNTAFEKKRIIALSSIKKDSIAKADMDTKRLSKADSLIDFSKQFMGMAYFYTGKTPKTGFDCSGFTHYVFKNFDIELSPASKQQIHAGERVNLENAQTGDLLVFTGTRPSIRKPGHVGIVISRQGERPLKFIHSSSNGGVKISQVDGTSYAIRLLQVRRMF